MCQRLACYPQVSNLAKVLRFNQRFEVLPNSAHMSQAGLRPVVVISFSGKQFIAAKGLQSGNRRNTRVSVTWIA